MRPLPLKMRLVAALDDCPIALATPPSLMVLIVRFELLGPSTWVEPV